LAAGGCLVSVLLSLGFESYFFFYSFFFRK